MRRGLISAGIVVILLSLTGCAAQDSALRPDMRLLADAWSPIADADGGSGGRPQGPTRAGINVDIWLDATPNVGGINLAEGDSVFDGMKKDDTVSGGFQYKDDKSEDPPKPFYLSVLRSFLTTAAGSRVVRVLRYNDEIFPDAFLAEQGVVSDAEAASKPDVLRSVRRDLMTYAVNPNLDLFDQPNDAFYSVGNRANSRMEAVVSAGVPGYPENPGRLENMGKVQEERVRIGEAAGFQGDYDLRAGGLTAAPLRYADFRLDMQDEPAASPLYYALDNMRLDHLNVSTCDTLGLKPVEALSGNEEEGKFAYIQLYQELLQSRGVFSKERLQVEFIAVNLDYCGFISQVYGRTLAEPFRWGRSVSDTVKDKKRTSRKEIDKRFVVAPRPILILLIGPKEAVEKYKGDLQNRWDADGLFQQERARNWRRKMKIESDTGPVEFSYGGIVQPLIPFSFDSVFHTVAQTGVEAYDIGDDYTLTLRDSRTGQTQPARREGDWNLLTIHPDDQGRYAGDLGNTTPYAIELSVEAPPLQNDAEITAEMVQGAEARVIRQLTLAPGDASENAPGGEPVVIAVRDKKYVYSLREGTEAEGSPFRMATGSPRLKNGRYVFEIAVNGGAELQPGYYRIQVRADLNIVKGLQALPLPAWLHKVEGEVPKRPVVVTRYWGVTYKNPRTVDSVLYLGVPVAAWAERSVYRADAWDDAITWDYTPNPLELQRWVAVATNLHNGNWPKKNEYPLLHAWGTTERTITLQDKKSTYPLSPDIPPVFRLLQVSKLAEQFSKAADGADQAFIDITFDVFVSNEPKAESTAGPATRGHGPEG
jgi:hypothetical protein